MNSTMTNTLTTKEESSKQLNDHKIRSRQLIATQAMVFSLAKQNADVSFNIDTENTPPITGES